MSQTLSKAELRRTDGFLVALRRFFDDLIKNSKVVTLGVALLVVIAFIGSWQASQSSQDAERAKEALFKARLSLKQDLLALVPQGTAPNVLTEEQRLDKAEALSINVDSQLTSGVQAYEGLIKKFPKTRSAFEARLILGDLYLNHGNAEKASSWYEQMIASTKDSSDLVWAYSALAHSKEASGKWSDALSQYQKALENYEKSNKQQAHFKGDFLLSMGRCYEGMNDKQKALQKYDDVIKQLPNTRYVQLAEAARARL